MLAEELSQFCDLIVLDPTEVRDADKLNNFSLAISITASQLQQARREHFVALCQAFGSAVALTIERSISLLKIEAGSIPPDVDASLEHLHDLPPTTELSFHLLINKAELVRELGLHSDSFHTILLFFTDRLIALLAANIISQDKVLFSASHHPTLIVVSEAAYLFTGQMLTVCGEQDIPRISELIVAPDFETKTALDRYYAFAHDQLNWSGFRLNNVTPLHYLGEWHRSDNARIQHLLQRNMLHLFVVYTANRASFLDDHIEASYASSEQLVTMRLNDNYLSDLSTTVLPGLVEWPVGSIGTDRLAILRSIVAREIDEDNPSRNYDRFTQRLRQVLADARWNYQVFVDGTINRHFEELDKVADDTARISTQVSDSIDTVTKGLTDALLVTVGAVVASFLAALIENKTQGSIFSIAMHIYALYLGFYLIFRMGSVVHSYLLLSAEVTSRFQSYADRLGEERVDQIRVPLKRRQRQFWSWFVATSIVYFLLALGVWGASTRVPQVLVSRGIISPNMTATVTSPAATPTANAATRSQITTTTAVTSTSTPVTTSTP